MTPEQLAGILDSFEKLAKEQGEDTNSSAHVHRRWHKIRKMHKDHGVMIGGHTRIAVPKRVMSEKDLTHHLGFTKVKIAVPEAGQKRFSSYRHHEHNYHVHDHDTHWTVHKDEHPSATMVLKKMKIERQKAKEEKQRAKWYAKRKYVHDQAKKQYGKAKKQTHRFGSAAKAVIHGVPHVVTEGVPGMYHYVKGKALGAKSTAEKVIGEQGHHVNRRFKRWRDSKTKDDEK